MSLLTRAAATLAAASVVLAPSAFMPAHADTTNPAAPVSSDPFYGLGVTGGVATAPADSTPGDVLDSRSVSLSTMVDLPNALAASHGQSFTPFTISATQLLYRTQNELGQPSATVTTVLKPGDLPTPVASKGVVAYLSYYDGLSNSCDPSYTLQGDQIDGEKAVIGSLLEQGYTVTVPDFEGETLDWAAGHEAGWSTLDAVRATESNLGLPAATTKVGLIGYSGGSFAGEWASELAPTYAPDVKLVGTAIGGVPANLRDLVKYVDSSADTTRNDWFGVIPAATVSLGRAIGKEAEFASFLSPTGQAAAADVSNKCIGDFADKYPNMHLANLVKPGIDFLNEPDVKSTLDSLTMGNGKIPTAPMLMVNGNNDGIGDGVMVAADVRALATKYCRAGLPVQYNEMVAKAPAAAYQQTTGKADHGDVGQTFMLQGITYLGQRFAGAAPQNNCAALIAAATPAPTHTKHAVTATLKGHSKGRKDVLVVTVKGAAKSALKGATVKLFRAGHKKAIGHGKIAKNGKATLTVTDHNGRAVTRYHAVVAATASTKSATTKVFRLR